jgi:hypothetical protein
MEDNLVRFPWSPRPETEEELHLRLDQLQRDMEDLAQKGPEEVEGDPMELAYYGTPAYVGG